MKFTEVHTQTTFRARMAAVVAVLVVGLAMSGCGKQNATAAGKPQSRPAEVGIVVVKPQHVTLTTELVGLDLGIPYCRSAAPSRRDRPEASVY